MLGGQRKRVQKWSIDNAASHLSDMSVATMWLTGDQRSFAFQELLLLSTRSGVSR